jgi:hypothetical protein
MADGSTNIVIGSACAPDLTGGARNILVGTNCGVGMVDTDDNICIGRGATSLGIENLCIGLDAGSNSVYSGTTGNYNILIGREAGTGTTGDNNIGIGTVGLDNAFNTLYVGEAVTTGSDIVTGTGYVDSSVGLGRNILFGAGTGTSTAGINECVVVGDNVQLVPGVAIDVDSSFVAGRNLVVNRGDNMCVFGRDSTITNKANLVTICNSDNFLTLGVTGELVLSSNVARKSTAGGWFGPSDQRLKSNIHSANAIICENIMRDLDLKRFTWNELNVSVAGQTQLGFIAQDVEKHLPKSIITADFSGIADCKLINLDEIHMVMYGVLKRSISRIDELETQISELKEILARNNLQ